MKNNVVRPILAALFLIAATFISCDKQDNGTGIGLFAGNNNLGVNFVDTFNVISTPILEDSIRTSGFSDVLLGSYHDPFFGDTKVSFYTQFLINESGVAFSDSAICDSVVFYAKLGVSTGESFYGPENKAMTFNVFRINNDADFSNNDTYYSSSSIGITNESLLDPTFENTILPGFTDSIFVGLDTVLTEGVLKLKLEPSFGQEIIDLSGTEVLSNNTEFLKVYKGLYVTTDGVQDGTILNINYASAATTMVIFYHIDTLVAGFEFFLTQDETAHFNAFEHNYETGSPELLAILQDEKLGNEKYFLQAGGGFSADIKLPALEAFSDSIFLLPINKAELILPVDPNTVDLYVPGSQIFISRFNEEGQNVPIADAGSANLGGFYDAFRSEYRFNITAHTQDFINGNLSSPDVFLEIRKPGTSPNRVMLNGHNVDTSNGEKNLKFRVYYSTSNN